MTTRAHQRGLCALQPRYTIHLDVDAADIGGAPAIYAGDVIIAAGGGDADLARERADHVLALLMDRDHNPRS